MVVVGNPQGIESRFLGQPSLPDEFLRAVLLGRKEVSVTHHAHPAPSLARPASCRGIGSAALPRPAASNRRPARAPPAPGGLWQRPVAPRAGLPLAAPVQYRSASWPWSRPGR